MIAAHDLVQGRASCLVPQKLNGKLPSGIDCDVNRTGVTKMNRLLKHSAHGLVVAVAVLVVPSALSSLSAAPFAFGLDSDSRLGSPGQVRDDVIRVHCCHSHPYPPYDRYCCHGSGYRAPGRAIARTAIGAAATYGAYRGVRSATKSAYKRGYNKAKKNYRRRR